MSIKKGTYVKITKDYLKPGERLETLPEATANTPLTGWIKGKLLKDGELKDKAPVETLTGRFVQGVIIDVEPSHTHTFGGYVKELGKVRETILSEMWGNDDV
ncbi:MAG: 2-amino-4-oxopentanoate thiolase subunit OrtA [Bacillota bacterium]